jgi:hypothetical protein
MYNGDVRYDRAELGMVRTQIYLTDEEKKAVESIADRLGKTQSEVIRLALDHFIERESPGTRANKLQAGVGLWRERDDLPDFELLRSGWDRSAHGPEES